MNSVTSSYLAKDRRVLLLSWSQERHLIKHSLQPGWCDQQQQFKIATRLPCERVWHAAGRVCGSHGRSAHRRQLGSTQVPQVLVERVGEDVVLVRWPVGDAVEIVDEAVAVGGAAQNQILA